MFPFQTWSTTPSPWFSPLATSPEVDFRQELRICNAFAAEGALEVVARHAVKWFAELTITHCIFKFDFLRYILLHTRGDKATNRFVLEGHKPTREKNVTQNSEIPIPMLYHWLGTTPRAWTRWRAEVKGAEVLTVKPLKCESGGCLGRFCRWCFFLFRWVAGSFCLVCVFLFFYESNIR